MEEFWPLSENQLTNSHHIMKINTHKLRAICAGGLLLSLLACSKQDPQFTLTNKTDIARTDEPITLSRNKITQKAGQLPGGKEPILISAKGDTIPSQLDDLDGDGSWDELAFLANVPEDTSVKVKLGFVDANDYPDFKARTNIRFGVKDSNGIRNRKHLTLTRDEMPVPMYTRFQMDGPAWENDKVGFRHYIDGRNARDLYGKTSKKMALDTVGISPENNLVDNYHVMEYWGRDILSVGNSLGIGGLAMINHGNAVRLGVRMDAQENNVDTTRYDLITEGPVRSIYQLTYKGWHVGDKKYNVKDQVSIWGGHYRYGNKVTVSSPDSEPDTLVVGLVNSNNDKPLMVLDNESDWIGLATHDKQTYHKEWYLGLSLILPKGKYLNYREAPEKGQDITTSYNSLLKVNNGNPIRYYVLAGWEISDKKFADRSYFKHFTETELKKVQSPVSIQ